MTPTERPVDRPDPVDDPLAKPADPGAYIGRKPERVAETIPGGVQPGDERIAANSTSSEPAIPGGDGER
jgi:hypothetical protein